MRCNRHLLSWLILLVGGSSISGCLNDSVDLATSSQPIVNGSVSSNFAGVGALISNGTSGCTATLIGARTVLTAAHCVHDRTSVRFFVGGMTGAEIAASETIVHPDYAGGNESDLALVRLSQPAEVAPLPIAHVEPRVGEPVVLLGFGRTGEATGEFGTKRETTNAIRAVRPQTIVIEGASGSSGNVCDGDSGGANPGAARRCLVTDRCSLDQGRALWRPRTRHAGRRVRELDQDASGT